MVNSSKIYENAINRLAKELDCQNKLSAILRAIKELKAKSAMERD